MTTEDPEMRFVRRDDGTAIATTTHPDGTVEERLVDPTVEGRRQHLAEADPGSVLDVAHTGDEPLDALVAIAVLKEYLEELEDEMVNKAVIESATWEQIGMMLGRSKQAVWRKYHDPGDKLDD